MIAALNFANISQAYRKYLFFKNNNNKNNNKEKILLSFASNAPTGIFTGVNGDDNGEQCSN